jgi:hypothetical protein
MWLKTNFWPTNHITLQVAPFSAYIAFPALLPFLRCILEVVFCERVHHSLRFLSSQLCKNQCSIMDTENRRICGGDSHIVFGQKFLGEKGSVRWCVSLFSTQFFVAKVRGEVFAHFNAVSV